MKKFKNKKTGKVITCDEKSDIHLIKDLEKNPNYKELIII